MTNSRGVLLGILGLGGGAARFSKSWPYFRPKSVIFHTRFRTKTLKSIPVFRPGLLDIVLSLLRWERQIKDFSLKIHFEFVYYSIFLSFHLELKQQIRSYTPVVPSKTIPDSRPKGVKTLLFGATPHYGLYMEVPRPPPPQKYSHFSSFK